ncbi:MAG: TRAP transporter small permease subunit [Deltaproteobacteria bacterium]|nr:TRAP transporter small permease subunit [Deltaproteobacteria bacterium]
MLEAVIRVIDRINEKQGAIAALLSLPLVAVVIFEVVMRYVFDRPTIWAFETTSFLYGVHYMMGLSYMELAQGHVKVDVLVNRLSQRVRIIVNILGFLVFFLPVFTLLAWATFDFAAISVRASELASTSWAPPVWPFKILMALGVVFLWLQGLANLFKQVVELKKERAQS